MNKKNLLLISIIILYSAVIYAQDITMDLGGLNHQGVYNTEPLREYTNTNWKTELRGAGQANLIIKDSVLYVSSVIGSYSDASRSGFIYAIDCRNGRIFWQKGFSQSISAPILKDTILYCGSDERDGRIRAISKNCGELVWDYPLPIASCWPPAVFDDKAFFGDHHGNWYVLNNQTGEMLYSENIKAGICCVPSVVDSKVYYLDLEGSLHRFDAHMYSDSVIYKIDRGANNSPVIVDNIAYIVNYTGEIAAIDMKSKVLLWSFKTDDTMFRSPSVSKDVVTVITTHGHIYALDNTNGKVLWSAYKEGLGYTNTTIAHDIVYVGCADNHLYAFDLKTGEELWKFKSDSPVNTPLVHNGTIYFTSGNNLFSIQ